MPGTQYINFNGSILDASQPVLMHTNRAFRYGDAVFETIRLMNGEILFFEKHLARLKRSMDLLSMNWHADFSFQNLHLLIRHLDQVNNLRGNGRIRLEVFRKDGGFYTPASNEVSFIIEAESVAEKEYALNKTGLRVDVFTEASKPGNKISNIKSSNALLYILAGLHQKKSGTDDSLLFNAEGNIAEAISSNVFVMLKGELCTPSLDQGCVAGVMRERILEIMKSKNKKCTERKISLGDLLHADEVFLTKVIDGIRWVSAVRHKRYFNSFSRTLLNELVEVHEKKA
jgi:branched-subunit amino acid aminotransferase/4-amino-4-deoxychorismate lyase